MAATRWATEIRWPSRPLAAAGPGTAETLLRLLGRDLERGHVHLAMRHLLMLEACEAEVPEALRRRCDALFAARPPTKREAITRQVGDWARMTRQHRLRESGGAQPAAANAASAGPASR